MILRREGSMKRIGMVERIYNGVETLLLKIVPKENVGPVFKWLFKMPLLQYKLGMGWMIGKYVLLLTTTGRKSGKPRCTPLEYEYDSENDRYRIVAGWGGNTDWFKNLKANPKVHVQVGRRKFNAIAEFASDEEVARHMMDLSKRYPSMVQVWNRWSDVPVDDTFESYVHAAKFFPTVWLKPVNAPHPAKRENPQE